MPETYNLPTPPSDVSPAAKAEFKRLFRDYPWTWKDAVSINLMNQLARNFDMAEAARLDVEANGVVLASPHGLRANPAVAIAARCNSISLRLLNKFEERVQRLAASTLGSARTTAWSRIPGVTQGQQTVIEGGRVVNMGSSRPAPLLMGSARTRSSE